jgi:hypothetical protein
MYNIIMAKTNRKTKKSPTKKKSLTLHESPLTAQHNLQEERKIQDDNQATEKRLPHQRSSQQVNHQPSSLNQKNRNSEDGVSHSKKSQKRARREALEDLEEERLTNLLFGDGDDIMASEYESIKTLVGFGNLESRIIKESKESFGFEIDRTGHEYVDSEQAAVQPTTPEYKFDYEGEQDDEIASAEDDQDDNNCEEGDAPVWEDSDDGVTTTLVESTYRLRKLRRSREETEALSSQALEQRLRERYEDTAQGAARIDWARTAQPMKEKQRSSDRDDDTEDDNDFDDEALNLFSTSKSLLASSRNSLAPNILNIIRCPDGNQVDPNKAVVRAVNFHPGSDPDQPLMLTAGLDKNLRFFHIGVDKSEKIHGIHCELHC